ncbi:MAG: cobalamin-dependent protein [Anaeromyxobacter sp.]
MPDASGPGGALIRQETLARYLDDLLAGRREACRATVAELIANEVPVRALYEGLFRDSLYEVGRRWEAGQATVAHEHLATAITEELLGFVFPFAQPAAPARRTAVVSCAADEFHQVGGRIVADVLESSGWDVKFLGANTPVADLAGCVRDHDPDLVALSVTVLEHVTAAAQAIALVREVSPGVPIAVGGQAFARGGRELVLRYPGVSVVGSLEELEALARGKAS